MRECVLQHAAFLSCVKTSVSKWEATAAFLLVLGDLTADCSCEDREERAREVCSCVEKCWRGSVCVKPP
jgi:hypothetical protein